VEDDEEMDYDDYLDEDYAQHVEEQVQQQLDAEMGDAFDEAIRISNEALFQAMADLSTASNRAPE